MEKVEGPTILKGSVYSEQNECAHAATWGWSYKYCAYNI